MRMTDTSVSPRSTLGYSSAEPRELEARSKVAAPLGHADKSILKDVSASMKRQRLRTERELESHVPSEAATSLSSDLRPQAAVAAMQHLRGREGRRDHSASGVVENAYVTLRICMYAAFERTLRGRRCFCLL